MKKDDLLKIIELLVETKFKIADYMNTENVNHRAIVYNLSVEIDREFDSILKSIGAIEDPELRSKQIEAMKEVISAESIKESLVMLDGSGDLDELMDKDDTDVDPFIFQNINKEIPEA